ncbi:MAG: hypothetical protein EBS91_03490 [Betaproteobacteria bacterium]|nr:hypothetical protein [Betaproteobacteria bacterium]
MASCGPAERCRIGQGQLYLQVPHATQAAIDQVALDVPIADELVGQRLQLMMRELDSLPPV